MCDCDGVRQHAREGRVVRDGVHVLLNDGLDRRIATPYKATEYVFRELDRQLRRIPRLDAAGDGDPASISR